MDKKESYSRYVSIETLSGVALLICSSIALILSNSSFSGYYREILETKISFTIGPFEADHSIHFWINEGLMAVFFFVVGLEIKREILLGELSTPNRIFLPLAAAAGGALVPALVYLVFNFNTEGRAGWGIPMATDIAFVLGIISLLGKKVPAFIKVFMLALAIIDDLIAILVITLFYSVDLNIGPLAVGTGIIIAAVILQKAGIYHSVLFLGLGILSWLAILDSGIHTTIAGVAMAMAIPAKRKTKKKEYAGKIFPLLSSYSKLKGDSKEDREEQQSIISEIEYLSSLAKSPMHRLEETLHPVTSFFILPVFAFANAGIDLGGGILNSLVHPVSTGIMAGLMIGKPLGIFLTTWASIRLKLSGLPSGVRWKHLLAMSFLGGMGFTMSLFISVLAFGHGELQNYAKFGVLSGSLLAAATGSILFATIRKKRKV